MLSQDAFITVTVETVVALPFIGFYCGGLYQNINLSMLRKSMSLYESQCNQGHILQHASIFRTRQ